MVDDGADDIDDAAPYRDGADELVGVGFRQRRSAAGAETHAPAERQRVRPKAHVGWTTINANPGYVTSYYFHPRTSPPTGSTRCGRCAVITWWT